MPLLSYQVLFSQRHPTWSPRDVSSFWAVGLPLGQLSLVRQFCSLLASRGKVAWRFEEVHIRQSSRSISFRPKHRSLSIKVWVFWYLLWFSCRSWWTRDSSLCFTSLDFGCSVDYPTGGVRFPHPSCRMPLRFIHSPVVFARTASAVSSSGDLNTSSC